MKKYFLTFSTAMLCALGIFAQTPYDNFAPEQSVKSMIELPNQQFKVANANTDSEVRCVEFDRNTLSLNLLDKNDSVIQTIALNPNNKKFLTIDPHAENYYSVSPYLYAGGNPILYVDPDGCDYWSTNDPELIKQFFNAMGSRQQYYDFTGWNHATDAQITGRLAFNDETKKAYTSYGTLINGEVTVVGVSFDVNLTPVSATGAGYPGAFVYNYAKGGGGLYNFAYDAAQLLDLSGFVSNLAAFDPHHYGRWSVNTDGRITGIAPLEAKGPNMGRSAAKYIKGYGKIPNNFHKIKENILNTAGKNLFEYKVGKNPDISVERGEIVLIGSGGGFYGQKYPTGLKANDFLP